MSTRNTITIRAHVEQNEDHDGGYRVAFTLVLRTMTSDGPWVRETSVHYVYPDDQVTISVRAPLVFTFSDSRFNGIGINVEGVVFHGRDYEPESGATFCFPDSLKREIKRLQAERDCALIMGF